MSHAEAFAAAAAAAALGSVNISGSMSKLRINQMVGDYRITGFLGAGGMGEVYEGVNVKIGRAAAIKVLSNRFTNSSSLIARFYNEARLQASLYHPNIAVLYDFQEIGDCLFIFMEFVDGESLDEMIKRRAFTVEDALRVFRQICEAVAFVHERGIIHRDIKAQNIKLTSDKIVKLLDFGIAKDAASQNLTKVGGIIGTPKYLAPEQIGGQPASPQSDVWSLGVLFYEMLTGVEPFDSDSIPMLYMQICEARFQMPEKLNPAIEPQVSQIVARCLKANAAERFQTAREVLEAIKKVLDSLYDNKKLHFFAKADKSEFDNFFSDLRRSRQSFRLGFVAAAATLAVVLLFGLIGVGIWAIGSVDEQREASANNSIIIVAPQQKNPSPIENVTLRQSIADSAATGEKIRVDAFGGKAEVFRDGAPLGFTPLDLEVKNGDYLTLTLKREGCEDKQVNFQVTPGQKVYTFAMTPKK
jgi:serine/threonine protein kinase